METESPGRRGGTRDEKGYRLCSDLHRAVAVASLSSKKKKKKKKKKKIGGGCLSSHYNRP